MGRSLAAVAAAVLAWGCGGDRAGPPRPAPTAVTAAFQEDGRVLIGWRLDEGPFDDLVLEARVGDGTWQPVGRLGLDWTGVVLTLSFQPTELQPLGFRITARRDGLAGTSAEAVALAPPRAPLGLGILGTTGSDRITVSWSNQSQVSTRPELSRQEIDFSRNAGAFVVLPVADGATSYQDGRPAPGRSARYRVRYLAGATVGLPTFLETGFSPIPVQAPVIEVVEGVGLRATTEAVGNVSAAMRLYEGSGAVDLPIVHGVATLTRWPPSPVLSMAVWGSFTDPSGAVAAIDGAVGWVPPFTIPGPRPLRASGPALPSRGALVRGADGRFHAFDGQALWVGEPGAFASHVYATGRTAECLPLPAVDALGRTHLVYGIVPPFPSMDPGPLQSTLAYAQHDAAGWRVAGIATYVGTTGCQFQARAAADGTVHVLLDEGGGTRWLVGVAGTFTVERALPGRLAGLAVAPDGTAYALTSAAFGVRDALGGWTDLAPPEGWQDEGTVLLAGGGGRLAALRTVPAGAGTRVAWRELAAGGWGAEETVGSLTGFDARAQAQVAAMGDDGDQAVVGGTGAAGPLVMARRGGAWQPADVPSLTELRSLGLIGGRLWVAGQRQYLAPGLAAPDLVRTALYEEP